MKLRIFAGPNGSGKSILYRNLVDQKAFHELPYINADDIKSRLDRGDEIEMKIPASAFFSHIRKSGFFTSGKISSTDIHALTVSTTGSLSLKDGCDCSDYLTAAIADAVREYYLDNGLSFTFETVMSDRSKVDLMRRAKGKGYRVYLYFITTSAAEINAGRVAQRVKEGGHSVPEDKISSRFTRSLNLLPEALAHTDRAFLFDNSSTKPELVAEVTYGNTLRFVDTKVPGWAAALVADPSSTD